MPTVSLWSHLQEHFIKRLTDKAYEQARMDQRKNVTLKDMCELISCNRHPRQQRILKGFDVSCVHQRPLSEITQNSSFSTVSTHSLHPSSPFVVQFDVLDRDAATRHRRRRARQGRNTPVTQTSEMMRSNVSYTSSLYPDQGTPRF
jgi:hypothetical protein